MPLGSAGGVKVNPNQTDWQQANNLAVQSGDPRRYYSSTGSQVLGGSSGGNSALKNILSSVGLGSGGGGGVPTASQYVAQKTGTAAPTASGGNVVPPPGAPGAPGNVNSQYNAQANPFLQNAYQNFQGLQDRITQQWNADPADMFAKLRANQSAMRNEQIQQAGQRGGMGMTNAGNWNIQRAEQQQLGQTAEDWKNMQLANRNTLLGLQNQGLTGAGGVASALAGNQNDAVRNMIAANTLGLDSWWKMNMLPIEQTKAQNSGVASILGALGSLAGLAKLV